MLHAAHLLKGSALDWFKLTLKNYSENSREQQDDNTNEVFDSFSEFAERLEKTFRNPDKE
ncbi:MAG: hypothetical protein JWP44_4976 [Mucilaginibacter sp.]|nr:hypothetical protein [Mucilaginibacter sp.]